MNGNTSTSATPTKAGTAETKTAPPKGGTPNSDKPDYQSWVGKSVITKNEKGLNKKTVFDIAEFNKSVPFAPHGRRKPAFKLVRRNPSGVHWEPCEDVIKKDGNYDEWVD